jgi:hypothetical protein
MVLDTDVLVAADAAIVAHRVLLTAALDQRYPVLASVPLMPQYESVLTRPEHLAAAGISAADVDVLLDAIALVVEPIESRTCGGRCWPIPMTTSSSKRR